MQNYFLQRVNQSFKSFIGALVNACADVFVENEAKILEGKMQGSLIDNISLRLNTGYKKCSDTAWNKIYHSQDVVEIELAGNQIITYLLDRLYYNTAMKPIQEEQGYAEKDHQDRRREVQRLRSLRCRLSRRRH